MTRKTTPPLWFKVACISLAIFLAWLVCFGWARLLCLCHDPQDHAPEAHKNPATWITAFDQKNLLKKRQSSRRALTAAS